MYAVPAGPTAEPMPVAVVGLALASSRWQPVPETSNAAQTASQALRPISPRLFREFNRWAADTWWGWCVTGAQKLHGAHIVVSGDPIPPKENAFVVANHQQMADITFLMFLARSKGRLGDLKWFVKKPIKYVPGVGWGMAFLDCLFIERKWTADRQSIARTLSINPPQVRRW